MLIEFLKTSTPKEKLRTALEVLHEFKQCEAGFEFIAVPFAEWKRLEMLEEFLEYLVNGKELEGDTQYVLDHPDYYKQEHKEIKL
jgi:hypothetical protein